MSLVKKEYRQGVLTFETPVLDADDFNNVNGKITANIARAWCTSISEPEEQSTITANVTLPAGTVLLFFAYDLIGWDATGSITFGDGTTNYLSLTNIASDVNTLTALGVTLTEETTLTLTAELTAAPATATGNIGFTLVYQADPIITPVIAA